MSRKKCISRAHEIGNFIAKYIIISSFFFLRKQKRIKHQEVQKWMLQQSNYNLYFNVSNVEIILEFLLLEFFVEMPWILEQLDFIR